MLPGNAREFLKQEKAVEEVGQDRRLKHGSGDHEWGQPLPVDQHSGQTYGDELHALIMVRGLLHFMDFW